MEALILILIEAFGAVVPTAVGGFFALIGSAISSTFALLLDLVMWRLSGTRKTTTIDRTTDATPTPASRPITGTPHAQSGIPGTVAQGTPSSRTPRRRWSRWVFIAASSVTALVLLILVVINQWFIDDLTRWLLDKQRERSGIAITAETIDGNLFTGRFQATGITVKRLDHPAGLIDLTVQRVDASIAVWRVFAKPLVVDSITVDGLRGRYERGIPGQAPTKEAKKPLTIAGVTIEKDDEGTTFTFDRPRKPNRAFIISTLSITNVEVVYADHTRKHPLTLPVTIARLTANPLRSQWAVLDVLFRANANGTVAGRPFTISTTGDDLGRDTQWQVEGLPIEVLADQIGGPFALLSAGTTDVHVTDHWRNSDDERIIVMDWKLVLNHVTAEVPENTSKLMALLAKPAVAFINSKGERVPLSFRVEIDEDRFDGAASAEAAGLWQVVGDSAASTLAKMLGIETDSVKDVGGSAVDAAKAALEKWRKKKKQE